MNFALRFLIGLTASGLTLFSLIFMFTGQLFIGIFSGLYYGVFIDSILMFYVLVGALFFFGVLGLYGSFKDNRLSQLLYCIGVSLFWYIGTIFAALCLMILFFLYKKGDLNIKNQALSKPKEITDNVRPLSVTVILWLIILASLFSIISMSYQYFYGFEQVKSNFFNLTVIVDTIISIFCCGLMFKGKAIGRSIYVAWFVIFQAITAYNSIEGSWVYIIVPNMIIFSVVLFILFRSKANQYFSTTEDEKINDLQRPVNPV